MRELMAAIKQVRKNDDTPGKSALLLTKFAHEAELSMQNIKSTEKVRINGYIKQASVEGLSLEYLKKLQEIAALLGKIHQQNKCRNSIDELHKLAMWFLFEKEDIFLCNVILEWLDSIVSTERNSYYKKISNYWSALLVVYKASKGVKLTRNEINKMHQHVPQLKIYQQPEYPYVDI